MKNEKCLIYSQGIYMSNIVELSDEHKKEVFLLLDRSRIKLMQTSTSFFGHILLQLHHRYDAEKLGIPTVAVSTNTIYYNLAYIHKNAKDVNDMLFIYMHEIMHLVLEHLDKNRLKERDPKLWNKACDYVINLDLFENGYKYSKRDSIMYSEKYRGMTPEQVYDDLVKNGDPNKGKGKGEGKGDGDEDEDGWSDIIFSDDDEAVNKIREMVTQAYNVHTSMNGSDDGIPGCIRNMMDSLRNPKLPWRSLLRKFVGEVAKSDFSWNRLNMPLLPKYYIPSLWSEDIGKIDFAIDVSGSVSSEMFDVFINEVMNVLTLHNITKIGVYQFDTRNISYDVVSNINELGNIEFHGGGGTDITDTLEIAKRSDAIALFVITDGYMNMDHQSIGKPTVWCVYDNPNFVEPFGTSILFDHNDI